MCIYIYLLMRLRVCVLRSPGPFHLILPCLWLNLSLRRDPEVVAVHPQGPTGPSAGRTWHQHTSGTGTPCRKLWE